LNVVPICLPALRDRREDIPLLARHFLASIQKLHGRAPLELEEAAILALHAHAWPGNVRELKNVIERLVILADGDQLTAAQVEAVLPATAAASDGDGEHPGSLRDAVRACERRYIQRAVVEAGGVMAEAARRLGLERSYLYRKMRDLGLERDD